ncbi:cation transporter [Paraburkholderia terrae]
MLFFVERGAFPSEAKGFSNPKVLDSEYAKPVAMQLFVVGGLASVAVGIVRALRPSPLDSPYLAVGVLCASGVIEGLALRATIRTIEPRHRAHGLLHWFRESGRSAVMLAVGEEFASVVGVVVSLIAVLASMLSGNPLFDAIGGIGVGIVLMGTALFSMREIKSLLVGESAHQHVREAMDTWLKTRPEIRRVVNRSFANMGAIRFEVGRR